VEISSNKEEENIIQYKDKKGFQAKMMEN